MSSIRRDRRQQITALEVRDFEAEQILPGPLVGGLGPIVDGLQSDSQG